MKTAIIVISEAGIALAKTLEQELPESEIFSTGTGSVSILSLIHI